MSERDTITVLVVDDQHLMREGLVALLSLCPDISVLGEAGDGQRAVELAGELRPDVVLMDLRMPVMDGVSATRQLRAETETEVLVLTTYSDDESIAEALRAGARGYLTKDAGRAEIASAVRSAASGNATFDAEVSRKLLDAFAGQSGHSASQSPPAGLTGRETEVLRLIADGKSNGEIARKLVISETTVKTHINNLFAKLGVRSRTEAMRYAYRMGLTE